METTMPQSKPKNKFLNRVFAIFFALILLTLMWDFIKSIGPVAIDKEICFSIILVGLLIEVWKPSLDFTFHRDRRRIFMSIILFAVFVLTNIYWWVAYGIPDWLPYNSWQTTFINYLVGSFVMDTSSLSLMFGILFLTNSTPQKSLSYRIMLMGVIFFELMAFLSYTKAAFNTGNPLLQAYQYFWSYSIFQSWFWLDLTSEIVIFIGAVWSLRKANIKILTRTVILILLALLLLQFLQFGFARPSF